MGCHVSHWGGETDPKQILFLFLSSFFLGRRTKLYAQIENNTTMLVGSRKTSMSNAKKTKAT
jgi:hypothetical protein